MSITRPLYLYNDCDPILDSGLLKKIFFINILPLQPLLLHGYQTSVS